MELARDVDVLAHDAQLLLAELATEARFGHAVADYAVGLGREAGAARVLLFHHRFDRTDDALDCVAHRFAASGFAASGFAAVRTAAASPIVMMATEGTALDL